MRTSGLMIAVAALALMPVPVMAQSYLSDATVCKRAMNADRSGWVEGSDYANEAAKRGLTWRACDEKINARDESNPSFLEAGVFFMTGFDPPDVKITSDRAIHETHQIFHDGAYKTVPVSYRVQEDQPCTIVGYMLKPPYSMMRMDFNRLPSPRAAKVDVVQMHGRVDYVVSMPVPNDTICQAKTKPMYDGQGKGIGLELISGTTLCDSGFKFYLDSMRRLKALDYIRTNFCAGQSEPPPVKPPPQKPY